MLHKFIILLLALSLNVGNVTGQKQFKVVCVAFYNFENLFDTHDMPGKNDVEFTPDGDYHYTEEIYQEKLDNLAEVVSRIGTDVTPDGAAILGVCEIENRKVLEDFVRHPKIADRNYQIVHFESQDFRGIDNALLYQEKYFKVHHSDTLLMISRISGTDTSYSRHILVVEGTLDGDTTAITVNHWPSRRGGEQATRSLRNGAAQQNRDLVDKNDARGIKTIVMGDLNDDPINESVSDILRAKPNKKKTRSGEMYNPYYDYYKRGLGTTAYRDAWSLFDQIILSYNFVKKSSNGFRYHRAEVFNEPWLTQKLGTYKGYPYRTYSFGSYIGGYSDHFPVYIFLVKESQISE